MKNNPYPHLNSPLRIRNTVFQNRLIIGPGVPGFAQASEPYPCDAFLASYGKYAKSGVGAVMSIGSSLEAHFDETENDSPDMGHMMRIDIMHPISNQHRFAEIAEIIKANGAVPICQCMAPPSLVSGYDVSAGVLSEYVEGDGSKPITGKEAPKELLHKVIDAFAENAALMKTLGFRMAEIHMAYRNMFAGRFLSRYTNKRTDEFGGSLENRARFPLMVCKAIKERCGEDFLVGVAITAEEPHDIYGEEGLTLEETCQYMKLADGIIDIISIREHQIDYAQGPGFRSTVLPNRPAYQVLSKYIRDNNLNIKLAYVCGAHDLDDCEDLITSGDADLILSSRAFITNPDLAVKMREGRNDDVVPCVRCSRCHHDKNDSWASVCTVNPHFAFEIREQFMTSEPTGVKNIAVIGAGCSGLKFAMEACDAGHKVTIYEKLDMLGGQLNLAGIPYVKTFLKKFRDYLVHQVEKRDIHVVLNTEIKPGDLDGRYDYIVTAIGSVPVIPNIPGIELGMPFDYALTHLNEVKGDVVVIGGGEVGLECALEFVRLGHKAKCIEMQSVLAPEVPPVHYRRPYREMWEALEDFSWSLNSTVTAVKKDGDKYSVVYKDEDGKDVSVACDTVVIAAGTRSLYDEALQLCTGTGSNYRMIGDCVDHGNVPKAMRTAYFTAHNL